MFFPTSAGVIFLSPWEAKSQYFKMMLHSASSDQKQMSALTILPRINLPKLNFALCKMFKYFSTPSRFHSFKTCHFLPRKHSWTTYVSHCWDEKIWENISSCPAYYLLLEKMGENRSSCRATVCPPSGATMSPQQSHNVGNKNFLGPKTKLSFYFLPTLLKHLLR